MRDRGANRGVVAAGVAVVIVVVVATAVWWVGDDAPGRAAPARQEAVAARGGDVMPFDLEATTHHFAPTSSGGVQDVVADAAAPPEQVELVRRHLREEAARFRQGDFDDPAAIHGDEMPGLDVLRDAGDRLTVTYADTAAGGRITYRSDDATVVEALHRWFDAQVSDHGAHAEHGAPTTG